MVAKRCAVDTADLPLSKQRVLAQVAAGAESVSAADGAQAGRAPVGRAPAGGKGPQAGGKGPQGPKPQLLVSAQLPAQAALPGGLAATHKVLDKAAAARQQEQQEGEARQVHYSAVQAQLWGVAAATAAKVAQQMPANYPEEYAPQPQVPAQKQFRAPQPQVPAQKQFRAQTGVLAQAQAQAQTQLPTQVPAPAPTQKQKQRAVLHLRSKGIVVDENTDNNTLVAALLEMDRAVAADAQRKQNDEDDARFAAHESLRVLLVAQEKTANNKKEEADKAELMAWKACSNAGRAAHDAKFAWRDFDILFQAWIEEWEHGGEVTLEMCRLRPDGEGWVARHREAREKRMATRASKESAGQHWVEAQEGLLAATADADAAASKLASFDTAVEQFWEVPEPLDPLSFADSMAGAAASSAGALLEAARLSTMAAAGQAAEQRADEADRALDHGSLASGAERAHSSNAATVGATSGDSGGGGGPAVALMSDSEDSDDDALLSASCAAAEQHVTAGATAAQASVAGQVGEAAGTQARPVIGCAPPPALVSDSLAQKAADKRKAEAARVRAYRAGLKATDVAAGVNATLLPRRTAEVQGLLLRHEMIFEGQQFSNLAALDMAAREVANATGNSIFCHIENATAMFATLGSDIYWLHSRSTEARRRRAEAKHVSGEGGVTSSDEEDSEQRGQDELGAAMGDGKLGEDDSPGCKHMRIIAKRTRPGAGTWTIAEWTEPTLGVTARFKSITLESAYTYETLGALLRAHVALCDDDQLSARAIKAHLVDWVNEDTSLRPDEWASRICTCAVHQRFGNPADNIGRLPAIALSLREQGHKVEVAWCDGERVMANLVAVFEAEHGREYKSAQETAAKRGFKGNLELLPKGKYPARTPWGPQNEEETRAHLADLNKTATAPGRRFLESLFWAPFQSIKDAPAHLRFVGADACHMSDKGDPYTLFSLLGLTSNKNTVVWAYAWINTNERTESWRAVLKFVKTNYPSFLSQDAAFVMVADGDKGLRSAWRLELAPDGVGFFLCAKHRAATMTGTGSQSLYSELVRMPTLALLENALLSGEPALQEAVRAVPFEEQFIVSRVRGGRFTTYGRSTTQFVEGDNKCIRTMRHLDPVTGLLWALEREEFRTARNQQAAVKRAELGRANGGVFLLTPVVVDHHNVLKTLESQAGLTYKTKVTLVEGRDGHDGVYEVASKTIGFSAPRETATYQVSIGRALEMPGSKEVYRCVGCACGQVMRDALPCKHVAFIMTNLGLPLVETFAPCWRSSTWRSQYQHASPVTPSHNQLPNFTSDASCFLAFAAPPKRGRPKSTRRRKSAQELARKAGKAMG
jgi:hypothetical protein